MSITTAGATSCDVCATPNPSLQAYCGGCGAKLQSAAPASVQADRWYREFREPVRLITVSAILLLVSAIIAAAAFVAIKAAGASSFWMDVGAPLANSALSAAGVEEIRAPTAENTGASWLIVAVFLAAFITAGISLLLLALGSLRLLVAAAVTARRQAAVGLDLGEATYAKAKPRIAIATRKGRETLDEDIKPAVSAGARRAVTRGHEWIAARRVSREAQRGGTDSAMRRLGGWKR